MPNFRATFSANQSVRAFLAEIGGLYHKGKIYDHKRAGWGLEEWQDIVEKFEKKCIYCGQGDTPLSVEHLIECNRFCGGLHHPGNTVPACSSCNNSRHAKNAKDRTSWQEHLKSKWTDKTTLSNQEAKLSSHLDTQYPKISSTASRELIAICQKIYKEAQALTKPYAERYAVANGFTQEAKSPKE